MEDESRWRQVLVEIFRSPLWELRGQDAEDIELRLRGAWTGSGKVRFCRGAQGPELHVVWNGYDLTCAEGAVVSPTIRAQGAPVGAPVLGDFASLTSDLRRGYQLILDSLLRASDWRLGLFLAWAKIEPFAITTRHNASETASVTLRIPCVAKSSDTARQVQASSTDSVLVEAFAHSDVAASRSVIWASHTLVDLIDSELGISLRSLTRDDLRFVVRELVPRNLILLPEQADEWVSELREFVSFWGREYDFDGSGLLAELNDEASQILQVRLAETTRFGVTKASVMAALESGMNVSSSDAIRCLARALGVTLAISSGQNIG